MPRTRRRLKAFTVIELLVVIAIIGLLASIVLVSTKDSRDKAEFARRKSFSHSIKNAIGSDIKGEWNFEGIDITDSLTDSTGGNRTAVVSYTSSPVTIGNDGVDGKALVSPVLPTFYNVRLFNSNSPGPDQMTGDEISFEMWVYPTDIRDGWGMTFVSYANTMNLQYIDREWIVDVLQEGGTDCQINTGHDDNYKLSKFLDLKKWNHIAGTYSKAGTFKLFINGKIVLQKLDCLPKKAVIVENSSLDMPQSIAGGAISGKWDSLRIYGGGF